MAQTHDGEQLIQVFFSELGLRHLDQCVLALDRLREYAQTHPAYSPWCEYLAGILANERDHDSAEAERIFSRLRELDIELALRGRVLLALGRAYDYQGRWGEAIRAYDDSLPIFAQLGQPIDQAKAWKQIAIAYRNGFARGDFDSAALQSAITYCQQALDVLTSVINPSADIVWLTGSVWNTRGAICMNLGQWDQAITCYTHDLDICRAQEDRFGMGLSYGNLGEIYQKRGRDTWPQALAAYQQALSLIREFDDEYEAAEAFANLGFLHQEMGAHRPAIEYYDQAIRLIEHLRVGVSSEIARAGFFATIVDTYANAILLCIETGDTRRAFDYVERARSRTFLDLLAAGSPDLLRATEASPANLTEIQASLPQDALLLAYFTTGLIEAHEQSTIPTGAQRHRFPTPKTLVFAVTHDAIYMHDAGLSPNSLRPAQLDNVVERHFLQPAIRRVLYERLVAPFSHLLEGKHRLYVAPHGPLHYIPFQALLDAGNATLLQDQGPELIYMPSATLLVRARPAMRSTAPKPCLALGYNGAGTNQLRFAEDEARAVIQLVGGDTLVGAATKKAQFYQQAGQYRLLHISCHGDFDPEAPLSSALHVAPGEVLTALDVLNHLRLRCDLVTLSACESGLSRVRRGDELIGLVRAFLYAGASALVCTLWRVDERSTRLLMERFYTEIQAGTSFAAALKHAQLYLMHLTRKQARDALVHILADGLFGRTSPASTNIPNIPSIAAGKRSASGYLKSSGSSETKVDTGSLVSGNDDERVFADPYYWAPFILIGDQERLQR